MSNRIIRNIVQITVLDVVVCFPVVSAFAQFPTMGGLPQDVYVSNTVVVNTPPKFSLWEGVDVAIESLVNSGTALSVENVLKELEDMKSRNEVRLPYSYSSKKFSTRKKPVKFLKPEEMKKKEEFAAKVAQRLTVVLSENPQLASAIPSEPQPSQFKSKKEFVDAYVSYKVENADEVIRAKYAKRLGGMNAYRFEMKREAENIWKLAQNK